MWGVLGLLRRKLSRGPVVGHAFLIRVVTQQSYIGGTRGMELDIMVRNLDLEVAEEKAVEIMKQTRGFEKAGIARRLPVKDVDFPNFRFRQGVTRRDHFHYTGAAHRMSGPGGG